MAAATGMLLAGQSHAFAPRVGKSRAVGLLKGPSGLFQPI